MLKDDMWVKLREGAKVDAEFDISPTLEYRVVQIIENGGVLYFVIVNDDGDIVGVTGEHFCVSGSDHQTYSRMTGESQMLVNLGRLDLLPKKSVLDKSSIEPCDDQDDEEVSQYFSL